METRVLQKIVDRPLASDSNFSFKLNGSSENGQSGVQLKNGMLVPLHSQLPAHSSNSANSSHAINSGRFGYSNQSTQRAAVQEQNPPERTAPIGSGLRKPASIASSSQHSSINKPTRENIFFSGMKFEESQTAEEPTFSFTRDQILGGDQPTRAGEGAQSCSQQNSHRSELAGYQVVREEQAEKEGCSDGSECILQQNALPQCPGMERVVLSKNPSNKSPFIKSIEFRHQRQDARPRDPSEKRASGTEQQSALAQQSSATPQKTVRTGKKPQLQIDTEDLDKKKYRQRSEVRNSTPIQKEKQAGSNYKSVSRVSNFQSQCEVPEQAKEACPSSEVQAHTSG